VTETETVVRLGVADPWSFTVLDTLRRRFGYDEVVGVHRMKSWHLVFDLESDSLALQLTNSILTETTLLANPNRDVWFVRSKRDCALPPSIWRRASGAQYAYVAKVWDRDDTAGQAAARILRSRVGIGQIENAHLFTLWVLEFSCPRIDPVVLSERIAVARSWRKGLLANPHFQDVEIHSAAQYLEGEAATK
jgi:phosphoribosylformylglycinamidine (FGAM) synthase PurS component